MLRKLMTHFSTAAAFDGDNPGRVGDFGSSATCSWLRRNGFCVVDVADHPGAGGLATTSRSREFLARFIEPRCDRVPLEGWSGIESGGVDGLKVSQMEEASKAGHSVGRDLFAYGFAGTCATVAIAPRFFVRVMYRRTPSSREIGGQVQDVEARTESDAQARTDILNK